MGNPVAMKQLVDPVVGNGRFRLGPGIGNGSFSCVQEGVDLVTGEQVAVKLESTKALKPQLQYEVKLYKSLSRDGGRVPKLRWHGQEADYNIMVLPRLGPSLADLIDKGYILRMEEISSIGIELLDCLQHMHDRDFVHRDIKPANIVMGTEGSTDKVHLVDFGLAKRYRYPKSGQHIPFRGSKGTFTGNMAFASLNSLIGVESSRRDDVESLGYLLVYLCRGDLPWSPRETEHFLSRKLTDRLEDVCAGCPPELILYLHHCQTLGFDQRPNYEYLQSLLQDCVKARRSSTETSIDLESSF